ncbi:MAG: choice-of-anchor D domain-containing protein [Myxococcota bacterium]|nr:choice-of-anchor D domain-containing protein [Myxococcota bacterium]
MTTTNKIGSVLLFVFSFGCIENKLNERKPTDDRTPNIEVDPEVIDFGYIDMEQSSQQTLEISNVGEIGLLISDIHLEGSTSFSMTIPDPITALAPGESAELFVSFEALRESDTGQVRIESNDAVDPELKVPLIGRASYPALLIEPDPYIFNYAEIGDHLEGNIRLISAGQATLEIQNLLLMGEGFTLEQPELPIVLEPEEEYEITVSFDPLEEKRYEGELWVSSNSPAMSQSSQVYGNVGSGDIRGRLCDPSGEGWVVGATVYVSIDYNNDGIEDQRIETTTDADGYFILEGVPTGVHTIYAEKGSFSVELEINFPGGIYEIEDEYCLDPDSVKLAVVAGEYDSIEQLLEDLELEYDVYGYGSYLDFLEDGTAMAEYDVIFFNCGMPFSWLDSRPLIAANMANFVQNGGSVYASDWAHLIVEAAWPERIDFVGDDSLFRDPSTSLDLSDSAYVGMATDLQAEVLDGTMQLALGSEYADITYDLDAWVVPIALESATPMLQGSVPTWDVSSGAPSDIYHNVPLAVKFSAGGTVIYTTFHNELQLTLDMEKALKEIILTL